LQALQYGFAQAVQGGGTLLYPEIPAFILLLKQYPDHNSAISFMAFVPVFS
jgi:hypothetical protein